MGGLETKLTDLPTATATLPLLEPRQYAHCRLLESKIKDSRLLALPALRTGSLCPLPRLSRAMEPPVGASSLLGEPSSSPPAYVGRGRCRRLHLALPDSGEVWWQPARLASPPPPRPALMADVHLRPQNRFQQIIQDMERKYATNRPLPPMQPRKPAKRARAHHALHSTRECGEQTGEPNGDGDERDAPLNGEDEEDGEEDDEGGAESDNSSDGSWFDQQRLQDDFIDDTEVYEEGMGDYDEICSEEGESQETEDEEPEEGDSGDSIEPDADGARKVAKDGCNRHMKSSGFFISRGALQSEAQARRMAAREERQRIQFELLHERRNKRRPAGSGAAAAGGTDNTGRSPTAHPPCSSDGAHGDEGSCPEPRLRGPHSSTGCSQWKALCRISAMLGHIVPDEDDPETAAHKLEGARLAQLVKDVSARAERNGISVRDVKEMIRERLGITLAKVYGWNRLSRTLAANLSTDDLARALTPVGASQADSTSSAPAESEARGAGGKEGISGGAASTNFAKRADEATETTYLTVGPVSTDTFAADQGQLSSPAGAGRAVVETPVGALLSASCPPTPHNKSSTTATPMRVAADASPTSAAATAPAPAANATPTAATDSGTRATSSSAAMESPKNKICASPSACTTNGPKACANPEALIRRLNELQGESEANLARIVSVDTKLSAAAAAAAKARVAGAVRSKRVRLTEEVIRELIIIVRCAQLEAYARAASEGRHLPLQSQYQPTPASWLTQDLLARLCGTLPLDEKAMRTRLINYSVQAAMPELVGALRDEVERLFDATTTAMRAAYEQQRAAHDAEVKAVAAASEQRAKEVESIARETPAKLIGEEVNVRKVSEGGKLAWHDATITAYDVGEKRHTLQYSRDGTFEELDLASLPSHNGISRGGGTHGEAGQAVGWRPKQAPAPKPKFEWDSPSSKALLSLLQTHLRMQEKANEWAKLSLPEELAASLNNNLMADGGDGLESTSSRALIDRLRRALPTGWLNARAIVSTYNMLHKQMQETKNERSSAAPPTTSVELAAPPSDATIAPISTLPSSSQSAPQA